MKKFNALLVGVFAINTCLCLIGGNFAAAMGWAAALIAQIQLTFLEG